MKIYGKIYIAIMVSHFCFLTVGRAQTGYIQSEKVKVAGVKQVGDVIQLSVTDKITTRSYTDGLGRTIQTVGMGASPKGKDIIQPMTYDHLGKQSISYLPYVSSGDADASYRPNALITEQQAFYQNGSKVIAQDVAPYMQMVFENSPLQRLLAAGTIGQSFQPGQHDKKYQYRSNNSTDGVINWGVNAQREGEYAAGSLSVTELIDEDGAKIIDFKDKDGQTVLKRQLANETVNQIYSEYFDTYYLYNRAGMLTHIIPPKALVLMRENANWSLSQTAIANLIFNYTYDYRGRLIEKKVPSGGRVYLVYDPLNRPVLLQDENLRANKQWNYIKYDVKGNAISQGIYTDTEPLRESREGMQTYVNDLDYTVYFEERTNNTNTGYYSNLVFPTANTEALSFSYYDHYDIDLDGTNNYSYIPQGLSGESTATDRTRGMPTMIRKRTVGTGLANIWLLNVIFYDVKGQIIQNQSNNHINYTAGVVTDVSTAVTDFVGMPLRSKVLKVAGGSTVTVETVNHYDHVYRLKSLDQYYNGNATAKRIAAYEYNELGQLITKKLVPVADLPADIILGAADTVATGNQLHVTATNSITLVDGFSAVAGSQFSASISQQTLQTVDYRYNIRAQLLSINNSKLANDGGNSNADTDDLFGMEMLYDKEDVNIGNTAYFSGRLSAIKWMNKDGYQNKSNERSYRYSYDKLNRLTSANYNERQTTSTGLFGVNIGAFNEDHIHYDENGNIMGLKRNALLQGTITEIDDLNYSYNSNNPNQLQTVTDGIAAGHGMAGFKTYPQGNNSGNYSYDASGNLVTDPYKGLALTYNILNRTQRITVNASQGQYIDYSYDAAGILLRKQVYNNGSTTQVTDYSEGFVFDNNNASGLTKLTYFAMPEGRIRSNGGVLKHEFVITDHQGNARVSIEANANGEAVVKQENSYYAYGMILPGSAVATLPDANKNLYNGGAEWQNDFGNLPDYQQTYYRNYDAVLGRFVGVDPMADVTAALSVYQYAANNPIMYNDPLGDTNRPNLEPNGNSGGGGGSITLEQLRNSMWRGGLGSGDNWGSGGGRGEWNDFIGGYLPTEQRLAEAVSKYGTTISQSGYSAILSGNFEFTGDRINYKYGFSFYDAGATGNFGMGSREVSINLNNGNANKGVGWDNSKLALDIGGGIYGAMEELTSSQGQWLGKNGKYYSNSWGGNQYTGSRSGAFKISNTYKWAGRATVGVSALIGVAETVNGYQKDGGQFGYNAQSAAAQTAGSIGGGLVGAEIGMYIGGGVGAFFGGFGAIPGAAVGGFVFGLIGGNLGGNLGQGSVNWYHGR